MPDRSAASSVPKGAPVINAVKAYNAYIRQFPQVLTAKAIGSKQRDYFEVTAPAAAEAPRNKRRVTEELPFAKEELFIAAPLRPIERVRTLRSS